MDLRAGSVRSGRSRMAMRRSRAEGKAKCRKVSQRRALGCVCETQALGAREADLPAGASRAEMCWADGKGCRTSLRCTCMCQEGGGAFLLE